MPSQLLLLAMFVLLARSAAGMCNETQNLIFYNPNNFSEGGTFQRHLNWTFDYLLRSPKEIDVVTIQVGYGSDTVYARAECYGDCGRCLEDVKKDLRIAAPRAMGAYECTAQCYLHYENYSFW